MNSEHLSPVNTLRDSIDPIAVLLGIRAFHHVLLLLLLCIIMYYYVLLLLLLLLLLSWKLCHITHTHTYIHTNSILE